MKDKRSYLSQDWLVGGFSRCARGVEIAAIYNEGLMSKVIKKPSAKDEAEFDRWLQSDTWLEYDEAWRCHRLGKERLEEEEEIEVQIAGEAWVRGIYSLRPGSVRRANIRIRMAGISEFRFAILQLPDFPVIARFPKASNHDDSKNTAA